MVTIKEFFSPVEAGLVQSLLSDHDIASVLADEHAAAWSRPSLLVPIRLQVADEDAERAVSLLREFTNS